MLLRDFPGAEDFIRIVDDAVSAGSDKVVTGRLRDALCRMIRERTVTMPDCVFEACADHYARRELYQSEKHGYSVVAMTWGPQQGTPIHDHSGMWCVEGVWHGQLEITQYDLLEHDERRFHFEPVGSIQAGTGSAGSLIPPHEYHTIRNPSDDSVAVSVHIYAAPLVCCSMFHPVGDDWFEKGTRELALD